MKILGRFRKFSKNVEDFELFSRTFENFGYAYCYLVGFGFHTDYFHPLKLVAPVIFITFACSVCSIISVINLTSIIPIIHILLLPFFPGHRSTFACQISCIIL